MEDPILEPIHRLDGAIGKHIRPDTPPLAIRMLKLGAEVRKELRVPSQTVNGRWIVCQSIGIARRYDCWVAVGRDDVICPLAVAFESASGTSLEQANLFNRRRPAARFSPLEVQGRE